MRVDTLSVHHLAQVPGTDQAIRKYLGNEFISERYLNTERVSRKKSEGNTGERGVGKADEQSCVCEAGSCRLPFPLTVLPQLKTSPRFRGGSF